MTGAGRSYRWRKIALRRLYSQAPLDEFTANVGRTARHAYQSLLQYSHGVGAAVGERDLAAFVQFHHACLVRIAGLDVRRLGDLNVACA